MRKEIPFDVETTTILNGSPYHPQNRLVSVGMGDIIQYKEYNKDVLQQQTNTCILIGHNIKFDIAWLRSIGINFSSAIVRDTQLAEFLISNQTKVFASLNELAEKYLGEHKLDIVKLEYWDKGIDTWFIPQEILETYLKQDLVLTYRIFQVQKKILKETGKWDLYLLQCADLIELQEMEYNGILLNKEKCIKEGEKLNEQIKDIKKYIISYTGCPSFNCSSGDHLSALLYGGTIVHTISNHVGYYKTGAKIGQPRYKLEKIEYKQDQLIAPLKGSELKKKGFYSVDEFTLKSLKPRKKEIKKLIEYILRLAKLEKLQLTYFFGIPKLMDEQGWNDNYIHGQLNQVVARTGRLSASKPNQQNLDPEFKKQCESRYE